MTLKNKLTAECFGTFWLVFGGCGSEVLAAIFLTPVTNLSVNPARSTGPALFAGGWAIQQFWLFWLAPIVGAVLAGVVYPLMAGRDSGE
jgi:aquaporin Z